MALHFMVGIQCPHCSLEVELDNGISGLFDCPHCGEEFEWGEMDEEIDHKRPTWREALNQNKEQLAAERRGWREELKEWKKTHPILNFFRIIFPPWSPIFWLIPREHAPPSLYNQRGRNPLRKYKNEIETLEKDSELELPPIIQTGEEFSFPIDESVSTFSGPASYWNRVALAISFFCLCLFALSAYQMNGGGSVWVLIFCLAVFLLTTLIEMRNISLYFVSRFGREVEEPQHGLIATSYLCSTIGLLIGGIILGPIGFILGLVAKSNGDSRGKYAMIFGVVVTVISLLITLLLFQ